MFTVLMVAMVLVAIALIALILIQHGKGAEVGAAFGSGASNTVFGSQGSGNFLSKATTWLALVFVACVIGISIVLKDVGGTASSTDELVAIPAAEEVIEKTAPTDVPAPIANEVGETAAPSDVPAAAQEGK